MEAGALSPFASWESFYVIVGSSAAALTGLQFVVMVLGAESNAGATEKTTSAYSTPTIVHFSAVLLLSAILSAPWKRVTSAAVPIGLFGALGVVYTLLVGWHQRKQTEYAPVMEDWIWHMVLPLVAYAATLAGALFVSSDPPPWLFVIGGAALGLLLIGIHNAWDAVTFLALHRMGRRRRDE
ncbi:MAG TPA: hypothetical protein VMU50_05070 [Polyangia bacterium]|nr:hypothetical protein [Polyangia bacterium]